MNSVEQRLEATMASLRAQGMGSIAEVAQTYANRLSVAHDSRFANWKATIEQLSSFRGASPQVVDGRLRFALHYEGRDGEQASSEDVEPLLKQLKPWRKGPVFVDNIKIDTEWRSDHKWDRVAPHISSLARRRVLDVGCGNGYHCFRMREMGAGFVLGIDPVLLNVMQFLALDALGPVDEVHLLPLRAEELPADLHRFDTVFSMGVLYHRKSPIDHLQELRSYLRNGGELVLETLVIEGGQGEILFPEDRYAMMRNVWFIPSVPTLMRWMERVGFKSVKLVDQTMTTTDEQRSTEWMDFESLPNFLNPDDARLTREGYPRPLRATLIASS